MLELLRILKNDQFKVTNRSNLYSLEELNVTFGQVLLPENVKTDPKNKIFINAE